jgi:hypothetical protein
VLPLHHNPSPLPAHPSDCEPSSADRLDSQHTNLTREESLGSHRDSLAHVLPTDSDLRLIIESWDRLPESVRRLLVETTQEALA